jgi:two-component system, probable response regulator PhcQ
MEGKMAKHKIMLVDDEVNVLNSLTRSLRKEGYELVTFDDPIKALAYLENETVDIVVSDHQMPSITGLEFLIRIKKKYPEIIRILLTGYADMEVAIRAVNEGKLYRFLTKPWDDEDLKQNLINALQLHDLISRNRLLLKQVRNQEDHIKALELAHPGIGHVNRDAQGAIIIDDF